jgi:chemotaxis protein MotB
MSRKRRLHPEEDTPENHERWLVSYADFITLLFAFFVMLYAMSAVNISKYKALSDGLLDAFGRKVVATESIPLTATPSPTSRVPPPIAPDQLKALAEKLKLVLASYGSQGLVTVSLEKAGVLVEISAGVLFTSGKADILPEPAQLMAEVGQVLVPLNTRIQVEGFTDNQPMLGGAYPTNWELSAARAASVARILIAQGADGGRVTITGHGENRPIADNDTDAGRARNRRVRLLIAPGGADERVIELNELKTKA